MTTIAKTASLSTAKTSDLVTLGFAALFGLGLLFVAGFAHASAVHDVAHDQRHAMAFPCH